MGTPLFAAGLPDLLGRLRCELHGRRGLRTGGVRRMVVVRADRVAVRGYGGPCVVECEHGNRLRVR